MEVSSQTASTIAAPMMQAIRTRSVEVEFRLLEGGGELECDTGPPACPEALELGLGFGLSIKP
jgi:hypothetical protein